MTDQPDRVPHQPTPPDQPDQPIEADSPQPPQPPPAPPASAETPAAVPDAAPPPGPPAWPTDPTAAPAPAASGYPPQPAPGYAAPPPAPAGQYGAGGYPGTGTPAQPSGAAAGYGAPPQNPYGGYQAAPPVGYGPPPQGSLPYVQHYFGPVASFGSRVVAGLIDIAITLIGVVPLVIGIVVIVASAPATTYDVYGGTHTVTGTGSAAGIAIGVLLIIAGGLVSLTIGIWNRIFKMGRTGQSVGKRAMGLMLIDTTTGRTIGAGKAFLREIVHAVVNQILYLSYLWMLWDTDKQTLGDKAVASTVIEVPKA